MNNQDEYTGFLLTPQIIPTSALKNRTKSGKRRPMTKGIASALYSKPINHIQFIRIARPFYGTSFSDVKKSVFLKNEITGSNITIDFQDYNGFMRMRSVNQNGKSTYYIKYVIPYPKTNRDLFIKLVNNRYI